MKKILAFLIILGLGVGVLVGSKKDSSNITSTSEHINTQIDGIELLVVTSYGGEDANRVDFEKAVALYEEQSGNTVIDESATSNEEWKDKIMIDFETGTEADVLLYFTGADADKLIEGKKVVSLEVIREEYPDFAHNMNNDLLPISTYDGKQYAIPVNGFWEGMYVNTLVLEEVGVEIPGFDYTWEKFLEDCEAIKNGGFTPIAASLQELPHYWFEFTTFNNGNADNHLEIPKEATDEVGLKWIEGLEDLKSLYESGYFPDNTLTSSDTEAVQMMADNQAAFLIDGSWKINWFKEEANIEDFTLIYVPAKGERKATDIVGGLSMGYYITQKAWDDEIKRTAAVEFITAMTTNEVVSLFGQTAVTALSQEVNPREDLTKLELVAIEMIQRATSIVNATQDGMNQDVREELFSKIQEVVTGKITAQEALEAALLLQ